MELACLVVNINHNTKYRTKEKRSHMFYFSSLFASRENMKIKNVFLKSNHTFSKKNDFHPFTYNGSRGFGGAHN